MFYIWSNEHEAWWKPGQCGYTKLLSEAGVYSREETIRICQNATFAFDWNKEGIPNELPVPLLEMTMIQAQ
jgi:hypothetical protein